MLRKKYCSNYEANLAKPKIIRKFVNLGVSKMRDSSKTGIR